jgi:hypothetical protein
MTKMWPFPGDDPIVRARKCAWAYRAALADLKPEVAAELDDRLARLWGERWITGTPAYSPDDWVNTGEAAQIVGISTGRINALRRSGRVHGFLEDGKRFKYKVSDLYDLSSTLRYRKDRTPVTVIANGASAPTDEALRSETTPPLESQHHSSPMCERLHPGESCDRFDKDVRGLRDGTD